VKLLKGFDFLKTEEKIYIFERREKLRLAMDGSGDRTIASKFPT